jgi:predicted acylesterase/phospholipase RssA
VGGSSIGAIIATGLALGMEPAAMQSMLAQLLTRGQPGNRKPSLEDWKFPGALKPLGLLHGRGGMMRGRVLRDALVEAFGTARMGDVVLPLKVKVGNLARRRTENVDSANETHKNLYVVDVCLCSAAVPGLIDNQQLDPHDITGPNASKSLYCDGGTGNNVPRAMWDDAAGVRRPTTVVRFVDDDSLIPAITPTQKVNAYWNIIRDAAESEPSKKDPALVWDVPIFISGSALDLSLTNAECERRTKIGAITGRSWLARNADRYAAVAALQTITRTTREPNTSKKGDIV